MSAAIVIALVAVVGAALFFVLKGSGSAPSSLPRPMTEPVPEEVRNKQLSYPGLPRRCLVTGGSGFLGKMLVRALVRYGDCEMVRIFDMRETTFEGEDGDDVVSQRVEFCLGDLTKKEDCERAVADVDVVFHVASPHAVSGNHKLFWAVNVTGTKNILAAAAEAGVSRFVYTSSASVIYCGVSQEGVDESVQQPTKFRDVYSETKAHAESAVLAANGDGMRTCAIRPHSIFGPGDVQFFPALVASARAGKTKFIIGDGSNNVDFTFAGNVVHGHLLAASKLSEGAACAGKAYFITNDDPRPFWGFMGDILEAFGYPRPYIKLPYGLCLVLSYVAEFIVMGIVGKFKKVKMTFTPATIQIAGTHHWYSVEAAKRDLGYAPAWTTEEALHIAVKSFPELRNQDAMEFHGIRDRPEGPFTKQEVAKHNTRDDAWIIVDNKVYDVTEYVDEHRGGDAILNNVGGDASEGFHGPQHPSQAMEILGVYYIGDLVVDE